MQVANYKLRATKERLAHYPQSVVEMRGDGNCLFRCFSHWIHEDQDKYMDIKKDLAFFVKKTKMFKNEPMEHWVKMSQYNITSVKDYVKWAMQDKQYGTYLEIVFLSELYQVSVLVFMANEKLYLPIIGTKYRNRIVLEFSSDFDHYNLME